jgi:hypothetical protein
LEFGVGVNDSDAPNLVRKALDAGDGDSGGRKTLAPTWVFNGGGASGK